MTIKIKTNEKDNELRAIVELPRRHQIREEVQTFSNSDMIEYLNTQGIKLEDYDSESSPTHSLTSYSTKNIEPLLKGEWVFRKKEPINEIKPTVQTSKRSKVKKVTNS